MSIGELVFSVHTCIQKHSHHQQSFSNVETGELFSISKNDSIFYQLAGLIKRVGGLRLSRSKLFLLGRAVITKQHAPKSFIVANIDNSQVRTKTHDARLNNGKYRTCVNWPACLLNTLEDLHTVLIADTNQG